jgi:hypothetical protein
MSLSWNSIINGIRNVLATSYKLTRTGFTDLYTDAAALGRETGDLILKHKLIPFSQAIQDVESQSVRDTPIFSPLSNLGIRKGSQLFNAQSSLTTNFIPIIGSFGHLADHPNESLPAKIGDIAFGVLDIPGVIELADTGRVILRGTDELSSLGRIAERLGKSKAFNIPLLGIGLSSTLFSGSLTSSDASNNRTHTQINIPSSDETFNNSQGYTFNSLSDIENSIINSQNIPNVIQTPTQEGSHVFKQYTLYILFIIIIIIGVLMLSILKK